jgi:hypothetical protein
MNRGVALLFGAAAGSTFLLAGGARAQNHGGIRTEEGSRLYHWLLDRMLEANRLKSASRARTFSGCSCWMADYRKSKGLPKFCAAAI